MLSTRSCIYSLQCRARTLVRNLYTRPALISPDAIGEQRLEAPPINHTITQAHLRKWLPLRTGILAQKRGMMPYFDTETGRRIPVTILELNNVEVLMHRTMDKNGYYACQIGYGDRNPNKLNRAILGHFAGCHVNPKAKVAEFRVKDEAGLLPIGTLLKPSFFTEGQYVDARSISKGKGFAGVMKRHNFAGLKASHGTSLAHRHGGSYGQHQDPGRVLPGKKMPGRMGGKQVTIQNVEIVKVDDASNVIWVKGSIPGPKGSYVKLQDAIKKPPFSTTNEN